MRPSTAERCMEILEAIDAIAKVEYLRGKQETMSKLRREQQWIPCSMRLPEDYGNYLVTYKTDDIEPDIATYDPDRVGVWSACDADGFYWVASKGLEVVAWMPLPNAYIEEK